MKNICLCVQNQLLREAIELELKRSGNFRIHAEPIDRYNEVVGDCIKDEAEILFMEIMFGQNTGVDGWLRVCKLVREQLPGCKLVFLVDENSMPSEAYRVMTAKQMGLIDMFFYSSVTATYLAAVLEAL